MIALTDFMDEFDRRWVRYVMPLLVGVYGLTMLVGLRWALAQPPTVTNTSLLRDHPYFAVAFLTGTGLHLVMLGVLAVLAMRRNRFATILLGAWFTVVAPLVLMAFFGFGGIGFVAVATGSEAVSFCLWRYNKTQVNGHEVHQGARLPLSGERGVITVAAVVLLVVVLSLVHAYADAVGLVVFSMLLLWAWSINDSTGFGGFLVATDGTVGIICILWGVSARAIDWVNIGVGFGWMAAGVFMWLMSIVLLRISDRRRRRVRESIS